MNLSQLYCAGERIGELSGCFGGLGSLFLGGFGGFKIEVE